MKKLRTHAAVPHSFLSWPVAACDNSSFHGMTADPSEVDCRICMYRIGWYVPLVKLREHQYEMRAHAYRANLRRAFK